MNRDEQLKIAILFGHNLCAPLHTFTHLLIRILCQCLINKRRIQQIFDFTRKHVKEPIIMVLTFFGIFGESCKKSLIFGKNLRKLLNLSLRNFFIGKITGPNELTQQIGGKIAVHPLSHTSFQNAANRIAPQQMILIILKCIAHNLIG